ncbi:ankyrin repeat-containing domain protein [Triangularia setosa]|uniref:Ankyrin repeat-containing domain protein n=1 Tax=Triangularia setosa TaxID=2587417 RepID=A0AAN6W7S0_9PEZI|nr:ankyrin repeat-containing domain protein [Podospora setosa]
MAQPHMNELARKPTRRDPRHALGGLPTKLDETYDQAMERIKNQDADDASLAHQVRRPLTIEELQDALAVMPGDKDLDVESLHDVEILIAICAELVTLEEESGYVRLVHYTTQNKARSMVATTCLIYMMFDPFVDRYYHVQYEMEVPVLELFREFVENILAFMSAEQAAPLEGKMSDYSRLLHVVASIGLVGFLGPDNITPLFSAVKWGREDMVAFLLSAEPAMRQNVQAVAEMLFKSELTWHQHVLDVGLLYATENDNTSLMQASGYVDLCTFLLDNGTHLEIHGEQALQSAAKEGHVSILKVLLERGVNSYTKDKAKFTSLLKAAAITESVETIKALLAGRTAILAEAISRGNLEMLRVLISCTNKTRQGRKIARNCTSFSNAYGDLVEQGADLNHSVKPEAPQHPSLLLLHYLPPDFGREAVKCGHPQILEILLDNGGDVNARSCTGKTPLHWAAYQVSYNSSVKMLLDRGAHVETRGHGEKTLRHVSAACGNSQSIELLLDAGADIEAIEVGKRHAEKVSSRLMGLDIFLTRGAKTDKLQPLVSLIENTEATEAMEQVCRQLVDEGLDFTVPTKEGTFALYDAIKECSLPSIKVILEQSADIDEVIEDSLYLAAYRRRDATINNLGTRPCLRAERIIESLYGADVNTRCGEKQTTVLHHAAWSGDLTMVRYLVAMDARTDITDKHGRTALDWAKENKWEAMVYLLTC